MFKPERFSEIIVEPTVKLKTSMTNRIAKMNGENLISMKSYLVEKDQINKEWTHFTN